MDDSVVELSSTFYQNSAIRFFKYAVHQPFRPDTEETSAPAQGDFFLHPTPSSELFYILLKIFNRHKLTGFHAIT
jgi:hypothetical protein